MALDITDAANDLAAEGVEVDTEDLATITPYIRHPIRRFGNWVLNLAPPEAVPATRLDLAPRHCSPLSPPEPCAAGVPVVIAQKQRLVFGLAADEVSQLQ